MTLPTSPLNAASSNSFYHLASAELTQISAFLAGRTGGILLSCHLESLGAVLDLFQNLLTFILAVGEDMSCVNSSAFGELIFVLLIEGADLLIRNGHIFQCLCHGHLSQDVALRIGDHILELLGLIQLLIFSVLCKKDAGQ